MKGGDSDGPRLRYEMRISPGSRMLVSTVVVIDGS